MDPYTTLVKDLYTQLQKPITPSKVVILLASAVKNLEAVPNMTGFQKREMALKSLSYIIGKSNISDEEKAVLQGILDSVGEATINLLVEFGKDTATFVHGHCHKGCSVL